MSHTMTYRKSTMLGYPNTLIITWDDLPSFELEFVYDGELTEEIFELRKEQLKYMAFSDNLSLFYSKYVNKYAITDYSKPNLPRIFCKIDDYEKDDLLYIFRTKILPRVNNISKP